MNFKGLVALSFGVLIITSRCAVPLSNTSHLSPGMTPNEVREILKDPYQTQFQEGLLIWDYHLQYVMNSSYPYRVIFDSSDSLVWYGFNKEESERILKALSTLKGTPALPYSIDIKDKK
ncbi:MAG: hypothetical protein HQ506_01370 [Candidatus Marinimicrobia bacterium]|nr:hypothetical protein [Candidatus Neomarinimicrobiota bacterium]